MSATRALPLTPYAPCADMRMYPILWHSKMSSYTGDRHCQLKLVKRHHSLTKFDWHNKKQQLCIMYPGEPPKNQNPPKATWLLAFRDSLIPAPGTI